MVEPVAQRGLDQAAGFRAGQLFLGLPLELRVADEHRQLGGDRAQQILGGDLRGALVAAVLAPGAQALHQGGAEPGFMRAALRGGHGVAVGVQEPVASLQPGDRPFRSAGVLAGQIGLAGPELRQHRRGAGDVLLQAVAQAAGEVQHRLGRDVVLVLQQRGVALPADFHAAEQIGLRPAQPVQPCRAELQRAEDLRVRLEADAGAAAVVHRAGIDQLAGRLAAGVALLPQHAVARHLHLHLLRQRVHHRAADAVQPAGGGVGLAAEFPARMQRGEDHLQRGQVLELRMRIDRDAAAVVAHREPVAGLQRHLDEAGMAGHRLVHGIVEDLRREMMQRRLVGAADIHAGAAADRFQPFQDLDVLGGIIGIGLGAGGPARRAGGRFRLAALARAAAEQIVHAVFRYFPLRAIAGQAESGQPRRRRGLHRVALPSKWRGGCRGWPGGVYGRGLPT